MKLSDLVEGYDLLRSISQLEPHSSETGRIVLLHDGESVRIYLTREIDSWENITLEIEIFMGVNPNPIATPSESTPNYVAESSISRDQLIESISLLEYLIRLEESGFKLEIVSDGCIWTARLLMKDIPGSRLFGIIVPPNHHTKRS